MKIPTHWSKACVDEQGNELDPAGNDGFIGVGWSDQSEGDAYQHALQRARKIARWFVHEDDPSILEEQYYADRPLREPVIDQMQAGDQQVAVVTQNIYGAFVLNCAQAMFIDIDVVSQREADRQRKRKARARKPGLIARLFGAREPEPIPEPQPQPTEPQRPEDMIRAVLEQHPGMGLRVYKTPNGYRGLVTDRPYEPGSDASEQVLKRFRADRLYMTLCRAQGCFRARLTPKPWRMGMDNPPKTFPLTDPEQQRAFKQWMSAYEKRSLDYAACEPLSETPWGNPVVHEAIRPVMAWHDELACSPGKPLA